MTIPIIANINFNAGIDAAVNWHEKRAEQISKSPDGMYEMIAAHLFYAAELRKLKKAQGA